MLICGLGSIGRRHLRHFRELGVTRIDAYRTGRSTLSDDGQPQPDQVYHDLSEALAQRPGVVVVANPTSFHVATARLAAEAGCHVLVEKPVSDSPDGLDELAETARRNQVVVSVAQNARHLACLRLLKEWVETERPFGRVLMARAHFGAFLPSWHPWEDFRTSYAARKDLGGGSRLTLIHEIDYLHWMLGEVETATGLDLGLHPLGLNVDEGAALVMRHRSGVLSIVSLGLMQNPPRRSLEMIFSQGAVTLDLATGRWKAETPDGRGASGQPNGDFAFEIDNTYRDQAIAFVKAVESRAEPPIPVHEAKRILELALAGKEQMHGRT